MDTFVLVHVADLPFKVECLATWGNKLYVGDSNGVVLYYTLTEGTTLEGTPSFSSHLDTHKKVGNKKAPIVQLGVLQDSSSVYALCDGNLFMLHGSNLEVVEPFGSTVKGVTTFAICKNSTAQRVCMHTKKKLTLYELFTKYNEITLRDNAQSIEWQSNTIVVVFKHEYALFDLSADNPSVPIFSIAFETAFTPLVCSIDGGFVLRVEQEGVYVGFNGIEAHTRVSWKNPPIALEYCQPYVVSVQGSSIQVHNWDQIQVQYLTVPGGNTLTLASNTDAYQNIFLCSAGSPASIYTLLAPNLHLQIRNLLRQDLFEHALHLFRIIWSRKQNCPLTGDDYRREVAKIHEYAGMILLEDLQFQLAFKHFELSSIDPRALISLVPNLLSPKSTFSSTGTATFSDIIANKKAAARQDSIMEELKENLLKYLEKRKNIYQESEIQKEIHTALVKLYITTIAPRVEAIVDSDILYKDYIGNWTQQYKFISSQQQERDAVFKKNLAKDLLDKAYKMLDQEKISDARCFLQISTELDSATETMDLRTELQSLIEEREKLTEHELLLRMETRIAGIKAEIVHAEQQAFKVRSEEEKKMIEQQMEVLLKQEGHLKDQMSEHEQKQKALQDRESQVEQRERLLSEQTKQLEQLLAELTSANTDVSSLQHQISVIQSGDKDVDGARRRFEGLQKAAKEAQQALVTEERRQRERVEWLQKQMELYRLKGLSPAQLSFRNFLKDVKRLSAVRNQLDHSPYPLRCFISYAWEVDQTLNKELQQQLQKLKETLETAGMAVTLDVRNMKADMKQFMVQGIEKAHKLLLICTPRLKERAGETTKNNLQLELETALEKAKTHPEFIVPLIFSGTYQTSLPTQVEHLLSVNLTPQAEYYSAMASLAPMGLIPMILGLEDNKDYKRTHDRLFGELHDFETAN